MLRASILLAALGVLAADLVLAQTYEPGHGALQMFNEEGRGVTPAWVRIWVMFMVAVFAAGL